jgi:hypothetical protein
MSFSTSHFLERLRHFMKEVARRNAPNATSTLVALAAWSFCVWFVGCGSHAAPDVRSSTALTRHLEGDRDDDDMNGGVDPDDNHLRSIGHAAGMADRQAIAQLVRRYYAAAETADGETACSLLSRRLAGETNLGEAAEAIYPPAPSSPPLRGEPCAQVMSTMFKAGHRQITVASSTLVVTQTRVNGSCAIAFLGFASTPERQLRLEREHGEWKVEELLDSYIP